MADAAPVIADLRAECADLDGVVAALTDAEWATPTPSAGWTIAHQIGHLAWTDDVAALAAIDPSRFQEELNRALAEFESYVDRAAVERAGQPPATLLAGWRAGRTALSDALLAVPPGAKIPWFGPPMSATSMATARIMETWAHGQDVYDALGLPRHPTPRLRHIAHIGVRTRDFAFIVRERPVPSEEFRVELEAADGGLWAWGPEDAAQRVTGSAADFCLLVTQRRHRDDLDLTAFGSDADAWLDIAQAFAGPPGPGRAPAGSA